MSILYRGDWGRYPNAIVHTTTTNESFLKQAEKYKRMKVKNWQMILALHQPELEFVDPHDPNLPEEIMHKIGIEVLENPWYFLREVARVPPQGGLFPGKFRANRGNIALWWSFLNHIDPCLIQPRQTGKSLSTDMLISYLLYIASNNARINLLTKDNALRVSNVERLKEIRDYLPTYLQFRDRGDSDNTIEIDCALRKNTLSTAVAQASKSGAYNIGRGLTAPVLVVDEGPYCDNIETTFSVIAMSGNAARDEAKMYGMPYGMIFTTTAGPRNTQSGRYMYDIIHNGYTWNEALFDAEDERDLHRIVEAAIDPEAKVVMNITMNHRQLGYTDEWMREKLRNAAAKGENADRDMFNRWTDSDQVAPLSADLLDRIVKSKKEPLYTEITSDRYTMKWYIPYERIDEVMSNNSTIMGIDMSEGIGRDFITLTIMDEQTLEVYATAAVNETNIIRYINWICKLMVKYDRLIAIPERRSAGNALIAQMLIQLPLHGIDPFKRIYNTIVDENQKFREEYKEIVHNFYRRDEFYYDKMIKHFGFATSGSGRHARDALYSDTLQHAARMGGDKCYDAKLISEIEGLESKNGRIDHGQGKHDDAVISWLLPIWMLTKSKNLAFYGLTKPLRKAREYRPGYTEERIETNEDRYRDAMQERIKEQVECLLENLRKERDDTMIRRYEYKLRNLESQMGADISNALSMDELIKEITQQRQQAVREQRRQGFQYRAYSMP